jgi:hypothetical protein
MKFNFESPLPFAGKFDIEGIADANDPAITRVVFTDPMGRKADVTKLMEEFNCMYDYIVSVSTSHSRKLLGQPAEYDYTLENQ